MARRLHFEFEVADDPPTQEMRQAIFALEASFFFVFFFVDDDFIIICWREFPDFETITI